MSLNFALSEATVQIAALPPMRTVMAHAMADQWCATSAFGGYAGGEPFGGSPACGVSACGSIS